MSTIRTRKNRQTGTMITVGRSDELQVNDGIGWAVTCEDHNVIMSCDTRKQAERQATAPLGWCQFCNGTADDEPCDCGKCAACITEEEHDGEYQELELRTIEASEATQERNERRPEGEHGRCLLCNAPVNPRTAKSVHVIKGGGTITTDPNFRDDGSDLAWLLIGPECYRKHKDVLKPFVEAPMG